MTEAMPFLQKYDITFLRPLPILPGRFSAEDDLSALFRRILSESSYRQGTPTDENRPEFPVLRCRGICPGASFVRKDSRVTAPEIRRDPPPCRPA